MKRPTTSLGNPPANTEIYEILFAFVDNVLFKYSTDKIAEDDITQDIAISLNEATRTKNTCFAFLNQYKERKFKADIGVHFRSNRYCFCWIEAKRLPTPKAKNRDEREYVIVDNEKFNGGGGGIQRFKEGKHAPNRPYSIMIGYIQDNNNVDYWLSKINTWIAELAKTGSGFWTNKDSLNKYTSNQCKRFISTHKRTDKTSITLHHYWIKF